MLCKFCRQHNCCSQKSPLGHAVWVDMPCKSFIRSSLVKQTTVMLTSQLLKWKLLFFSSGRDRDIVMVMQRVVSAERKAFIVALKCMYFLNYRKISHTINFVPILELAKSLGASYLSDLKVDF